jgi:hypothetical protein
MSGCGGIRTVRCVAAFFVGMVAASSLTACAYENEGEKQPTMATRSISLPHSPTVPAEDPDVLAVEKRNYAELDRRLAGAPGSLLLSDSGPANGPGVGFTKAATVKTPGPHIVTAACIGVSNVQIYLSQPIPGGTEHKVVDVDCTGVQTQTLQLHEGYVGAQLMHPGSNGAWTGAVGGIKITFR